jgi:hypothetical protein
MERLFESTTLGTLGLANRFVFPPIKLGYGNPNGSVSDRQLTFYGQIAQKGPGLLVLEPVPVTPEGKEHPKQLCVHHPESETELKKIVNVIHGHGRLACLHLNRAGAAANPAATKSRPAAPSIMTCPSGDQEAEALTEQEIDVILAAYQSAAVKAVRSNFDAIEIQAGHGYLVSQFLNGKINKRKDDRILYCGYCLQGCLHRLKSGQPLGCNLNPEVGLPSLKHTEHPLKVLVAGGGSAGMSAASYMSQRGHQATLAEKQSYVGGQFALAWQVPGKNNIRRDACGDRTGRDEKDPRAFSDRGPGFRYASG